MSKTHLSFSTSHLCSVFSELISTKSSLFISVFQFRLQTTMQCKPQSNEHFPLSCSVFFAVSVAPSSCFSPTPSLLRALRTLIPITTKRAIRLSGQSPVHSAADGGQAECLKLLIQRGFDVNALLDAHISGRVQLDTHIQAMFTPMLHRCFYQHSVSVWKLRGLTVGALTEGAHNALTVPPVHTDQL